MSWKSARLRRGWNPKYPCSSPFTEPWLEQRRIWWPDALWLALLFASFSLKWTSVLICLPAHPFYPILSAALPRTELLTRGWGSGFQKTRLNLLGTLLLQQMTGNIHSTGCSSLTLISVRLWQLACFVKDQEPSNKEGLWSVSGLLF